MTTLTPGFRGRDQPLQNLDTVLVRPIVQNPAKEIDVCILLRLSLEKIVRLEDDSFRKSFGEFGSSFADNVDKILNDTGDFPMGFRDPHG